MDIQTVVSLIGSLGFPIVMCLIMFKYIEQVQADNKETIEKMTQSHKEETDSLKDAFNNNTQVLTELKTMIATLLGKDDNNEHERN